MRRLLLVAPAVVVALGGCDSTVTATIVTIEARPAVHGVDALEITFGNDNATLSQTFDIDGRTFPLSFSVETPGRTGEIAMTARGLDADGALAALGLGTATIVPDQVGDGLLILDPSDFAVNTTVAGQQRLAWQAPTAGTQIAADSEGNFTIGFTDDCGALARCDLWGRRFDVSALAQVTEIAASDVQFNINRTDVFGNDPAMAVNADGTMLAAWTTFSEILAVAITPTGGGAAAAETVVSTGDLPDEAAVAALPDGRFVVVWIETDTVSLNVMLRGRFLDATGAPSANPQTGTTGAFDINTTTNGAPSQPAVIASGNGLQLGFVWRVDTAAGTSVRARFTNSAGLLVPSQEAELVAYDSLDAVWGMQIASAGDNRFLVGWGHRTFNDGPVDDGAVVIRQIAAPVASQIGTESLVARGLADSTTRFSMAGDDDGAFMVTWHGCGATGDDNGCGVLARLFRVTGLPVGEPIVVNTTLAGDQTTPSVASLGGGAWVATWTDDSGAEPDTAGSGIRARVIYPPFTTASGVLGADCGGTDDADCGDDLVCMPGTDGPTRCHAACDPGGPAPQCPGGGVCTTSGSESGCLF